MMGRGALSVTARTTAFDCHTLSQCLHHVSHYGWGALLRLFDFLAVLLLLDQLLESNFVVILEFLWREMPGLGLDEMGRQIEHVLGDFFIGMSLKESASLRIS